MLSAQGCCNHSPSGVKPLEGRAGAGMLLLQQDQLRGSTRDELIVFGPAHPWISQGIEVQHQQPLHCPRVLALTPSLSRDASRKRWKKTAQIMFHELLSKPPVASFQGCQQEKVEETAQIMFHELL